VSEHGPIVQFPMGPHLTGMLIASANGADRVLRADLEGYVKGVLWEVVGRLSGNGLAVNPDLEDWRRQRRLMNPAFSRPSVQHYVGQMQAVIPATLDEWLPAAERGEPLNITGAAAELTQAMILKTLFGTGISQAEREQVGESLVTVLGEITRLQQIGDPTAPMSPEGDQAIAFLDSVILGLATSYRERLGRGEEPEPHLMGQLIAAADEAGSMSPKQLRDELTVAFLAGYETTAMTLQWMLYALAGNPAAAERLDAEIATLAGRAPTYEEIKDLAYLQAVINETLRFYPALPYIPRQRVGTAEDTIDGYTVPAGAVIFVGAWHIHRDPDHWGADAAQFNPERWLAPAERHKAAFLPFALGARICIGEHLSRVALALALVAIRQRFDAALVDEGETLPMAMFTLRPHRDILLRLAPR
ncbi:MAG TPA: cytochrome P450, partial [Herpetosiphonaceae bacterium]|nr:cytochrome P450 [Herpetosiphonaceae bacterium]